MERIAVLNNKRGMSLIEVMIALLILMVVSMALLQSALLGMRENLRNAVRDEAVNIADQKMNELRSTPTASIALGTLVDAAIPRKFRASTTSFTPTRTVTQVGSDPSTKQVTMAVTWVFSGQTYTHSVTTIMRPL
jgi:type IV pilus assembly protein PilV